MSAQPLGSMGDALHTFDILYGDQGGDDSQVLNVDLDIGHHFGSSHFGEREDKAASPRALPSSFFDHTCATKSNISKSESVENPFYSTNEIMKKQFADDLENEKLVGSSLGNLGTEQRPNHNVENAFATTGLIVGGRSRAVNLRGPNLLTIMLSQCNLALTRLVHQAVAPLLRTLTTLGAKL